MKTDLGKARLRSARSLSSKTAILSNCRKVISPLSRVSDNMDADRDDVDKADPGAAAAGGAEPAAAAAAAAAAVAAAAAAASDPALAAGRRRPHLRSAAA